MSTRRGVVTVVIIAVVMIATIVGGILSAVTERRAAPVASPVLAAPALPPEVEAKLAAYRDFLAEVDGTLHALRLEWHPKYETYLSWNWPGWLTSEQLDVRLDDLVALSRSAPASPRLDEAAARYVEAVRAELPGWKAGVAAWKEGEAAYVAANATMPESFERFGVHSQALRAAMPSLEPTYEARTWPYVEQLCLAGVGLMAIAAAPEPVDAVKVEAELASPTVYVQPEVGALRALGLRCSRAALDLLEHSDDEPDGAQDAVRLGLILITEETRRATLRGAYITALGNYAQIVAYTVRRP